MVDVFIPSALRRLTGGAARVPANGRTVGELVADLDAQFPGLRDRLCEGDRLRPGLAVVVGAAVEPRGLLAEVPDGAEVHFVQAVGGG